MDIAGTLWAIRRETAEAIRFRIQAIGPEATMAELAAAHAREMAAAAPPRKGGAVAIIPITGMILQRTGYFGTSTERVSGLIREAVADGGVQAIVLDVASPGGEVYGVAEAAQVIREARKAKPIVSVANSLAASAAYWLASQADEMFITPSGEAGSIGVYGMHVDMSKALEAVGFKVTLISAGKYKTEGNPFEGLSPEAQAAWQENVERYYDMFVADVARGRGVGVAVVRDGFGEGRVVGAVAAVAEGMATKVGTLDDAIRRAVALAAERRRSMAALAQAQVTRGSL